MIHSQRSIDRDPSSVIHSQGSTHRDPSSWIHLHGSIHSDPFTEIPPQGAVHRGLQGSVIHAGTYGSVCTEPSTKTHPHGSAWTHPHGSTLIHAHRSIPRDPFPQIHPYRFIHMDPHTHKPIHMDPSMQTHPHGSTQTPPHRPLPTDPSTWVHLHRSTNLEPSTQIIHMDPSAAPCHVSVSQEQSCAQKHSFPTLACQNENTDRLLYLSPDAQDAPRAEQQKRCSEGLWAAASVLWDHRLSGTLNILSWKDPSGSLSSALSPAQRSPESHTMCPLALHKTMSPSATSAHLSNSSRDCDPSTFLGTLCQCF